MGLSEVYQSLPHWGMVSGGPRVCLLGLCEAELEHKACVVDTWGLYPGEMKGAGLSPAACPL